MVRIGITLGDPAGIGYEITAKSLTKYRDKRKFTLIGNHDHFFNVLRILNIREDEFDDVKFIDIPGGRIEFGKVQEEAGRISYESVRKGIELALKGDIDTLVTAPINKESWQRAGSRFIDHTRCSQTQGMLELFLR